MVPATATAAPSTVPHAGVRSAYVHVPFCIHRCGYCDFTVIAGRDDLIPRYLAALRRELETTLVEPHPVDTLFLGGGTPSQLSAQELAELLAILREWLPMRTGGEWSIECNPDGLTSEKIAQLVAAGVTRVSLGAQSFDANHLLTLERRHSPDDIATVIRELRVQGVRNVSLDLIYAIPGQSLADWQSSLEQALALQPEHLSTYGLTFEKGTRFWTKRERSGFTLASDDLERDMYALAMDLPAAHGYQQYELSNHALPGRECRHNQVYWTGLPYFGFGPGAAAYLNSERMTNHRSVTTWLQRVERGESPVQSSERLNPEEAAREAVMLGLRQIAGIDRAAFESKHGVDPVSLNVEAAQRFMDCGWLSVSGDRMSLTRAGRFVADAVVAEFL